MSELNDFGTNPAYKSMFPTYLPGMALFQYFLQEIYTLVTGLALDLPMLQDFQKEKQLH